MIFLTNLTFFTIFKIGLVKYYFFYTVPNLERLINLFFFSLHLQERRSLTAGECSMCGESFTNAAKLVAHMRNMHGTIDKTYQCESCEYRGATHSALKAHMRAVHENIRKHRCDYCEFTSFASSALKRHILAIHEKRKPFECDKVCMQHITI